MPRVTHFEIHADDPDRLGEFYAGVFGWTVQKKWIGKDDYWLIHTGLSDEKGIHGGIRKRSLPARAPVVSIDVPDFDDYAERIVKNGGKLITPKIAVTGSGYLAYCEDTEGNFFAIIEKDPTVK